MSAQREHLVELVENLPEELVQEVTDSVLFILERRKDRNVPVIPATDDQTSVEVTSAEEGPFAEMAQMAERYNIRSGRSDISSRAGELAGEAIVEHFLKRRMEQDGDSEDSH
jgi:hypothetical protein